MSKQPPISSNLIAHRGWRNRYPENTAIAIEKAIAIGAKHVEIDIQLSADHVAYLSHDNALNRLCNSPLKIVQATSKQIQALSVYEPQRLGQQFINTGFCSLSQCVQLLSNHPQVTLYAEIKHHSIQALGAQRCLDILLPQLEPIEHHCVIISFDVDILLHAKKAGWKHLGPVLSDWSQAFQEPIASLVPDIVFCDLNLLTHTKTPADLPFATAIYEIGTYEKASSLLQSGAHLIETFCIGELIKQDNIITNQ